MNARRDMVTGHPTSTSRATDAASPSPNPEPRSIRTRLFGEIQVSPSVLFSLKFGMPGFESATTFVLVELRSGAHDFAGCSRSTSLISASSSSTRPRSTRTTRSRSFVARSRLPTSTPTQEIVALAICRIPSGDEPATANLLAPIGLGLRSRRGAQISCTTTSSACPCLSSSERPGDRAFSRPRAHRSAVGVPICASSSATTERPRDALRRITGSSSGRSLGDRPLEFGYGQR